MKCDPLTRKYRPKAFDEVIGQQEAVKSLRYLLQNRHPALLLTGMRGIGKTTLARLFAKALNCPTDNSLECCQQCMHCDAIQRGEHVDVLEIDAASNTKVESVRELLENICYVPTMGRYKIYIFDEVHMLSRHSFNALLKILEEPPKHVQFIFATTEPSKIPETVTSRLFTIALKPLSQKALWRLFETVFTKENILWDSQMMELLIQASCEGARDGLTLVDQLLAQGNGQLNLQNLQALQGGLDENRAMDWVQALHEDDHKWLSRAWSQLSADPMQIDRLFSHVSLWMHRLATTQFFLMRKNHPFDVLPALTPYKDWLLQWAPLRPLREWVQGSQIFTQGRKDILFSPTPRIHFEAHCLSLLTAWHAHKSSSAEKTISNDLSAPTLQETTSESLLKKK